MPASQPGSQPASQPTNELTNELTNQRKCSHVSADWAGALCNTVLFTGFVFQPQAVKRSDVTRMYIACGVMVIQESRPTNDAGKRQYLNTFRHAIFIAQGSEYNGRWGLTLNKHSSCTTI